MKIIFFGTGRFGLPSLKAVADSRHELLAVVTQPDRKKGRGWKTQPTPVKEYVRKEHPGLEVIQPDRAGESGFIAYLNTFRANVFVAIDYGQILVSGLLSVPDKGCINLHPSLLPKYRGAAPVNRAILAGEKVTGNSVFIMDERMDAGPIIAQEETEIDPEENALDLLKRLSVSGADLVVRSLNALEAGKAAPVPQDDDAAVYAPKIKKEEGRIDWGSKVEDILLMTRGLYPWPGTYSMLEGKVFKVLAVSVVNGMSPWSPGEIRVSDGRLFVSASDGVLRLDRVHPEGKKAMKGEDFLRGHDIKDDTFLA